jgi:hypothetical protein
MIEEALWTMDPDGKGSVDGNTFAEWMEQKCKDVQLLTPQERDRFISRLYAVAGQSRVGELDPSDTDMGTASPHAVQARDITIHVSKLCGDEYVFKVAHDAIVSALKNEISKTLGMNASDMKLAAGSTMLPDDAALTHYIEHFGSPPIPGVKLNVILVEPKPEPTRHKPVPVRPRTCQSVRAFFREESLFN